MKRTVRQAICSLLAVVMLAALTVGSLTASAHGTATGEIFVPKASTVECVDSGAIKNATTLTVASAQTVTLYPGKNYVRFTHQGSETRYFRLVNDHTGIIDYTVTDAAGDFIPIVSIPAQGYSWFTLTPGATILICLYSMADSVKTVHLTVEEMDVPGIWYADGVALDANVLYLERGESVQLSYVTDEGEQKLLAEERYNYITFDGRVLTVNADAKINYIEHVSAIGEQYYRLWIVTRLKVEPAFQLVNKDDVYLTWDEQQNISGLSLSIRDRHGAELREIVVARAEERKAYIIQKVLPEYLEFHPLSYHYNYAYRFWSATRNDTFTVTVNWFEKYNPATGVVARYQNGIDFEQGDMTFHGLFGNGTGTREDPYQISAVRHLHDMAHILTQDQSAELYFRLTEDLALPYATDWDLAAWSVKGILDLNGFAIDNAI